MKLKRSLSLLLAAVMLLTFLPGTAIPASAETDYNQLVNGNFDQGETGWANNGIAPVATVADGMLTLATGKTASGDARTYNEMQLAPGTYQLSFEVKGTPAQYRPYVGVSKNYWTNDYGQFMLYNYSVSDSKWTTVTETFTVPASAANAEGLAPVFVTVWNSNTAYAPQSKMYLDNFDVRKLLTVTNQLTNATLGTPLTEIAQGKAYESTVIPSAGHTITKVTVTMGGAQVSGAYDAATGKIAIAAVTGDLNIQVEAAKELSVTTQLSNASLSQSITKLLQGQTYENTVTAAEGYGITNVTVTMGGAEVAGAYNAATGKITVSNVTADLTVTVKTVALDANNLMTNGSFDFGATGWANNNIAPVATIADGVLKISTGKASGDARTYYALQLEPGTYQLSFEVKGTPDQYRPYVGVSKNYWTNDYGQYFMFKYADSDTEWITVTETFTVPASAANAEGLAPVYVTLWNSNGSYAPISEMFFDNFEVRKLFSVTTQLDHAAMSESITQVAQGKDYVNTVVANTGYEVTKVTATVNGEKVSPIYDATTGKLTIVNVTGDVVIQVQTVALDVNNLLTNGSFNRGTVGWANNGIAPVATVADGMLTLATGKTASGDARTYNEMQLAPGTYQLSFEVKGTPAQYRPYVGVSKNYWTNDYGQFMLYNYSVSDSKWTTVTETFTVPASAANAEGLAPVFVTVWNSNTAYAPQSKMYLDNFKVYRVLSVTAQLNNATLEGQTTQVVQGQSYTNTLTANAGYEITKVTVTMGGTELTGAYDAATGKITIAEVTGDVQIQVETVKLLKITATLTNATLQTQIDQLSQGESYANTVAAAEGYEVSKVTVTMGGAEVAGAYDAVTGKITVANVTADLAIVVETVAIDPNNLITNGSFNRGNTGWANNGIAPVATIADGKLTISTGKASGDARTYNEMQLAPGTYQLSFDFKGTPTQYRPYVGVSKNYWTNEYGQYFMSKYAYSDTEWTTVTEIFTVPESAADPNTGLAPVYITVWSSNASYAPASEMHFDNFDVRKVLKVTTQLDHATLAQPITGVAIGQGYTNTIAAQEGYGITKVTVTMGGVEVAGAYDAATGKLTLSNVTDDVTITVQTVALDGNNLITNGGFDFGNTGWKNNSIAPVATIADGKLTISTGKASGDARTYNEMQLAPGTYQLSFDFKGTPTQYRPYVGVSKNYWTNDYGQYFMINYAYSNTEWTTVREIFTVPESAADPNTGLAPVVVTLWSSNTSYAPASEMHFDNFDVRKVLKVTTQLDHATLTQPITGVAIGQSYTNTVTADSGYGITKVTVTMGGVEVTGAYDAATGKITVPSVTDALTVQVQTLALDPDNLISNGGFDFGTSGWKNNSIAPVATIADGKLTLSTGKTGSGDARTYNEMQLAPGTYQLSFAFKGTPAQYRPYVGVSKNYWTNDYGQYFMFNYAYSDTEWTTVTEIFTVPESAADPNTGLAPVVVTVWNSNTAFAPASEMHFDNFEVRKVLKVTTQLTNASLQKQIAGVVKGQDYVNTVVPTPGFEITQVVVKMGGVEIAGAYDAATGKITVSNVTADVTVRVEAASDSLIVNGNFDYGDLAWSHNDVAPAATITDGKLVLPTEKTASGDARTYNTMQLAPGTYQLSFDVKGTPAEYRPYVSVSKNYWSYDYGQYFMYRYDLRDDQWTTITEVFTVPESAADPNTGLAPVVVTVWNSNTAFAPLTEMSFDNFKVRRCVEVTVQNPDGKPATGLAEYTVPIAVTGDAFEMVLAPETVDYTMTVSCAMSGTNVPVIVNSDGTVTIRIPEITGDIVITSDSRKSAYTITNAEGVANSNAATSVAHGQPYTATITSSDPGKKLYSVSYTMGRVTVEIPVTDNTGLLSIEAVTGDITVQAVLVHKNTVAMWKFDVSRPVTGIGAWGDGAQTISIAHNGYYDTKNPQNGQPIYSATVTPDLLSITTNLPASAASWADAATVIGYKLPADLELGATYVLDLPIYAGNDKTSMVSSRNNSTKWGMDLAFTTVQPSNMWNAGDSTVSRIYAEGNGVLATSAPSLAKLPTDTENVYRIAFQVTEKVKAYAAAGNYLAVIIHHQHKDGSYQIGNASLRKLTNPVTATYKIGQSICDGPAFVEKGESYVARLVAKPGNKLLSATCHMKGAESVKLTIENGVAYIYIEEVIGNIVITASTKSTAVAPFTGKPAVLGSRPNPSPYDDYPYICEEADNLMPNFGFEGEGDHLVNAMSKIEADENAWEGQYSLHYAPILTSDMENLLENGDFAQWDPANKTISGWSFNNPGKLSKLELVELDGRHAVKLLQCSGSEEFNMELLQKVYLEADFTYTFAFDFYGVAHWGPNLIIYDGNKGHISSTNSQTTGTEGEWTTLSTTFRPTTSGYYYFAVRIHNAAYPQKEQYVSNCSVTLKSTRVEYALKNLKRNTDYWLTLLVKAAKVESVEGSFITFGITDPTTGNFLVMQDPTAEAARPYKPNQQLVPMAYDGQWHILTVPFNTRDVNRLNFTIDGLNCEAWFDNIYIFEAANAKPYIPDATDLGEAVVTDAAPQLLGCQADQNLLGNYDLSSGDAFWGDDAHPFGLFGNVLTVADSGSEAYGNALHYAAGRPANTYYIKWVDVEPNTEYTFSARYAIVRPGDGFMGLINGYRMESDVTENRVFPTLIAQFGFGEENYQDDHRWQSAAVSFNSGDRNRIGFVICDAGGEAFIDELRLFKTSDAVAIDYAEGTVSQVQKPAEPAPEPTPTEPAGEQEKPQPAGYGLWIAAGAVLAAAAAVLIILQKKRKK